MIDTIEIAYIAVVIAVVVICYLYLRAGYNICSGYRSVGQEMVKFFGFVDKSKEFKKEVKTRKIEPNRAAFIKCVLCAPVSVFYEHLCHAKR